MHKFFSLFLIILSLCLIFQNAEAKRFGGGRSFGVQRTSYSRSSTVHSAANRYQPASHSLGRWFGPIVGLVAGGLIASLLMGHGLATGILTWIAVAILALLLINLFRSRISNPALSSNYQNYLHANNLSADNRAENSFYQPQNSAQNDYPLGFNAEEFLRDAKVKFIRLQTAYDQKNLTDIRQFASPEVFAEIQIQLNERGNAENYTEVVNLQAELVEVTADNVASVRFSGLIKEALNQPATTFAEIWHFQQDSFNKNWQIVGIQQL